MARHPEEPATQKIPVGISSCLLGSEVRFNGGHKRDAYINGTLSEYFEFIPVCPEVAIGLGVPREPIRLVAEGETIRVVGVRDSQLDVTNQLTDYGRQTARRLPDICGYILKKGSPSCGMERVKVYSPNGMPVTKSAGAFARALMDERPLLPIEEEGRLGDPMLRENFIERVFVYHRWQTTVATQPTPKTLVDFHSDHKYLILAHNQAAYRRMGKLVANAGKEPIEELADSYFHELMTALQRRAGRRQHVNVMHHLLGYLKKHLDASDRAEMVEIIDEYREGRLPLIVPITLLRHHFRRHPHSYIERQVYLSPHPSELMLRNLI